jgi:oxygen-independent coproporphyrinogen-3 oxidase
MLMLGVRTREGVALAGGGENVEALVCDGLLEADAFSRGRAVLTRRGRLLADGVIRALLDLRG